MLMVSLHLLLIASSNFVALTPKDAPVEKKAEVNKAELQKAIEADKALDETKEYKNATIELKMHITKH